MSDAPSAPAPTGVVLSHNDLIWAVVIAVLLSLLIACIEIPTRSKTRLLSCVVIESFFYFVVLSFGNAVTTVLASLAVVKMPDSLSPYGYILCPFFGVFGFETILKNTNVTMFDRGVLTIQNWIEKALNSAAGASIERDESLKQYRDDKLCKKIMTFTEEEINTRILNKLGSGIVEKLDAAAKASGANTKQYKALQLVSSLNRSEGAALMRSS